jgi:hypothetical protein
MNLDPLRIHGAYHVPTSTVLSGPVDSLQNDEQAMAAVRVKFALEGRDAREVALKFDLSCLMRTPLAMEAGIDLAQVDLRTGLYPQPLRQIHLDLPDSPLSWRSYCGVARRSRAAMIDLIV